MEPTNSTVSRSRLVGYWVATVLTAAELGVGGVWDLLRLPYVRTVFTHFGYPAYLLIILGAWKVAGAVAILIPRFPRLKEWAYAGAFFSYTGALASHLAVGDGIDKWAVLIVFAGLLTLSACGRGDRRPTNLVIGGEPHTLPAPVSIPRRAPRRSCATGAVKCYNFGVQINPKL